MFPGSRFKVQGSSQVVWQHLERHQLDVPVDASDPRRVVPHCADDAGDMAAMTIDAIVHRIGIIVDKVPASDVVHLAIAGNFRRIRSDIGEQFGVDVVDAGIDYGHYHGAAAGVLVPG